MGVQFDEQGAQFRNMNMPRRSSGGMVGFLLEKGIVKSESQANMFLVGVFVFCVAASIFFYNYFNASPTSSNTSASSVRERIDQVQNNPNLSPEVKQRRIEMLQRGSISN